MENSTTYVRRIVVFINIYKKSEGKNNRKKGKSFAQHFLPIFYTFPALLFAADSIHVLPTNEYP